MNKVETWIGKKNKTTYSWFDVPVDDFVTVQVFQTTQNLTKIVDQYFIRKRHVVLVLNALLQITIANFHDGDQIGTVVRLETCV